MRVAMFTRFPHDISAPRGGVHAVMLALSEAFATMPDIDLHIVTMDRKQDKLEISEALGATIHRLPGPPVPQLLDVVMGPGRAKLRKYLLELEPDVVHFQETYGLGLTDLPVPTVMTIHGFDHANIPAERQRFGWIRAPLWKRAEAWGFSRLRQIISITPYVRDLVAPLTSAEIHDIDNPINASFFDIERRTVPGRILFAGWITNRKNPLSIVESVARLRDRGVDTTLHLAGEESDADYARKLKARIAELRVGDHVKLLGRITRDDIQRELAEARVFVLPSYQENAPMAIAESMAAGVPVISTNLCGMPYMIDEGKTGFLVDPDDYDAQADRIERIMTEHDLAETMADTARTTARERFHPISVANKTRAVYQYLLEQAMNQSPAEPTLTK